MVDATYKSDVNPDQGETQEFKDKRVEAYDVIARIKDAARTGDVSGVQGGIARLQQIISEVPALSSYVGEMISEANSELQQAEAQAYDEDIDMVVSNGALENNYPHSCCNHRVKNFIATKLNKESYEGYNLVEGKDGTVTAVKGETLKGSDLREDVEVISEFGMTDQDKAKMEGRAMPEIPQDNITNKDAARLNVALTRLEKYRAGEIIKSDKSPEQKQEELKALGEQMREAREQVEAARQETQKQAQQEKAAEEEVDKIPDPKMRESVRQYRREKSAAPESHEERQKLKRILREDVTEEVMGEGKANPNRRREREQEQPRQEQANQGRRGNGADLVGVLPAGQLPRDGGMRQPQGGRTV